MAHYKRIDVMSLPSGNGWDNGIPRKVEPGIPSGSLTVSKFISFEGDPVTIATKRKAIARAKHKAATQKAKKRKLKLG